MASADNLFNSTVGQVVRADRIEDNADTEDPDAGHPGEPFLATNDLEEAEEYMQFCNWDEQVGADA